MAGVHQRFNVSHLHAPVVPEVIDFEAVFDHLDGEKLCSASGTNTLKRSVVISIAVSSSSSNGGGGGGIIYTGTAAEGNKAAAIE